MAAPDDDDPDLATGDGHGFPAADGTAAEAADGDVLPPFATRPVLAIAAATAAVMLALATRYGYHRDEPYYLMGGSRLDWGYVDHPPLVPLLAHLVDVVSGRSLLALRAIGAVLCAGGIVASGFLARELGGGRRAQVFAAFAVAASPILRGPNILVGTTGFDEVVWCVLLVLVARLARTGRPRWWLAIGAAAAVGLETKWTVLILMAAAVIALAVERRGRLLWSPWALAGGLIALAGWAPNLVWNARHEWASVAFQQAVRDGNGALAGRIEFLYGQFLISGVVLIVVWWPGLRWLWQGPRGGVRRVLAVTAVAAVALVFLAGGKFYYVAPVYVALLAAGAVALEGATAGRRHRATGWVVVAGVVSLPLSLPVLPAPALNAVIPVNKEMGEMVGWPELVDQVRNVVAALPPEQRARTAVLTANYGEAGALERAAPELRVASGQNSYWWWGPPPDTATSAVVVGYTEPRLAGICADHRLAARIDNAAGVDNDERGDPIWVCDRLTAPWSQLWPGIRRYS